MKSTAEAGSVTVAVDGSESSIHALREAAKFMWPLRAELDIITCWTAPDFYQGVVNRHDPSFEEAARKQQMAALEEAFAGDCPVPANRRLVQGRPGTELVKASEQAQLLVMGTRGHGGFASLVLGSVSLECIAHAHCPVLTVRAW